MLRFDKASNPLHKINNNDMMIFFCSSFIVVVISIFVHIIILNEKSITSCLPEGSGRFVKKISTLDRFLMKLLSLPFEIV